MNGKHVTFTAPGDGGDEIAQKLVAVLIVNTNAGFHRHRDRHHVAHRLDAVGNQRCLPHQAGTEHAVLYPIRRATDVEVDLVVAALLSQFGAVRQRSRIAAAQLQRHRMFFFAVGQIVALTVDNRAGSHHLGIQQGFLGQQAVEVTAMTIGPVEHRRDGETAKRVISLIIRCDARRACFLFGFI
ncbi:hypothetical protein D3C80_578340 [compost metagenome]